AESPLETSRQVLTDEPVAPSRLRPRLPRDLETICLKCLGKEPAQRYASALALAEDLERFRDDRPILARRSGPFERAWRWCRRNPWPAATGIAVATAFLILLIGANAAAWKFRHQRDQIARALIRIQQSEATARQEAAAAQEARDAEARQRQAAEDQRNRAVRAEQAARDQEFLARGDRDAALAASRAEAEVRRRAEDAEKAAHLEADKAQAVSRFLTEDLLVQAEPENNAAASRVTLREVLDRAAAKVGARFGEQPEAEASVRRTIAQTYHGLGAWGESERHWRIVREIERRRAGAETAPVWQVEAQIGHMLR